MRFKLRKNRRLNTQKTLRFKVNSQIKYVVENRERDREGFVIDNNPKRKKKNGKKTSSMGVASLRKK